MRHLIIALLALTSCSSCKRDKPPEPSPTPSASTSPAPSASASSSASSCLNAKNTCKDYAPYWRKVCPPGKRCVAFKNSCSEQVLLAYNIGCDGDGDPGAPQCACSHGPILGPGATAYWEIVNGDYTSCLPSWKPPCLTASLAVVANTDASQCASGTRVEFSAGNSADPYGKFDSYNLDIQKKWFSIPVKMSPQIACAVDHQNHDCRPLWCGNKDCPDAYATPTNGGCADGRSPQAGCQDTFSGGKGYMVEYCPKDCKDASVTCPSCQDAKACP